MDSKAIDMIAGALHRSTMCAPIGIRSAKERAARLSGIRLVAIDLAASIAHAYPQHESGALLQAFGFTPTGATVAAPPTGEAID